MTEGQKAYRKFLQSDFWKNLSAKKRLSVGVCEKCGSTKNLQAHHINYPKDWFDSTMDDLQVLCRSHHMIEHGLLLERISRVIPHSRDERYNRLLHWIEFLRVKVIMKEIPLKAREAGYLDAALRLYPSTDKNRAMQYQVTRCLEENEITKKMKGLI